MSTPVTILKTEDDTRRMLEETDPGVAASMTAVTMMTIDSSLETTVEQEALTTLEDIKTTTKSERRALAEDPEGIVLTREALTTAEYMKTIMVLEATERGAVVPAPAREGTMRRMSMMTTEEEESLAPTTGETTEDLEDMIDTRDAREVQSKEVKIFKYNMCELKAVLCSDNSNIVKS